MKHLKFCTRTAFESGFQDHPETTMSKLGINYQFGTPQTISDQWFFWNCENIPDQLPAFLTELDVDPLDFVGWGLSRSEAVEVKRYKIKRS